jgi:aspartyl-tRNA(Asn)/glutamyl-tRNA(Gln) amidotransferase subunit A
MVKIKLPLTIKDTQEGLLRGKFNAVELVDTYLGNIDRSNKAVNALLTVTKEKAYQTAKKIDKLIQTQGKKAFESYPLLGVSIVHKDLFLTKGIRTTAASKVLEEYVPVYSAHVVDKLEKLGTIMIGKANCDAWAHGSSGENSDYGPTKNPWNLNFVPGGSSSGSAASLASNFALMATGTDTCGSVRLPANYCGIVGLKPTYGVISRYGVIAMASSLDCVGLYSHKIEDIEKIFKLIKGGDGHDATVKSGKYPPRTDQPLAENIKSRKLKVGVPKEFFGQGLDDEIRKNIEQVLKVYKKLGVEIRQISLPHTKYGISVYYIIQPAEVSSNLGRYDGIRYGKPRNVFSDEAKRRIMLGTYVLSAGYYDAYYLKAMKVRSLIIKEIDQAFEKVDAIIAPVAPTPPFALGAKTSNPLEMYLTDIFAATANLSGIPSLAIPSGYSQSGLPLGYQLMAKMFSEDILFELGKKYHQEIDWKPKVALNV